MSSSSASGYDQTPRWDKVPACCWAITAACARTSRCRSSAATTFWAGGDCVEVLNLVSGQYQHVALGTHANKQGRVIGHNLAGSYATFPGVVGTAVSKVCHLEIARTGLRERDARRAGFAYVTVTVQSGTKAAYFPGTRQMTVKMIGFNGRRK